MMLMMTLIMRLTKVNIVVGVGEEGGANWYNHEAHRGKCNCSGGNCYKMCVGKQLKAHFNYFLAWFIQVLRKHRGEGVSQLLTLGSFQSDVITVLHNKNLPTDEQAIWIGDLTMFMQSRNCPLTRYLKNITKILNHLWVILTFSLRLFPQNNYLPK